MLWRWSKPDPVILAGSAIGLGSVFSGWLTLKPNRVAAGTPLSVWEASGWNVTALLLLVWLGCLALSFSGKTRRRAGLLGGMANLVLVASLALSGSAASRLLAGEELAARVSPGAGVWLGIFAVYVLLFSSRQELNGIYRALVTWSGLAVVLVLLFAGWFDGLSIMQEYFARRELFLQEMAKHIALFASSVALGTLLGIPLGVWAARSARAEKPVFFIANVTQTVPSLALFGLLIAPLSALSFAFPVLREWGIRGIGVAPAFIALVIYTLLPIVRNTYTGLRQVAPAVIDAGTGMGMGRAQRLLKLEVPLAAPLVLEGVRTASVQAVGNTAVAAFIGAGGLGFFVLEGLYQTAADLILLGALPIIALALATNLLMRTLVRLATPVALRKERA